MSKFLPNTWYYSGPWLRYYRELGHVTTLYANTERTDLECPECGYPEAVMLSVYDKSYPLRYWCQECGLLWAFFGAKCPECGMFLWNKDCPDGVLTCTHCNMVWEEDMIKELYEEGENEYD